jgi:acetyl esterase/lipase
VPLSPLARLRERITLQRMYRRLFATPVPEAEARIPYGPDPLQFGDLRLPDGPGPHPLLVVIHGGFWRAAYDLTHIGWLCRAFTAAGAATWSIEYRRLGNAGGGWPGTFQDVGQAVDHLRVLAPHHALDLDRMVVTGHSAGGHLALWTAGRARIPAGDPLYRPDPLPVRAVVGLAAVSDLRLAWRLDLSDGVVEDFLGGAPESVPARYAVASPAELLPLGVPQTLVHGTADADVPFLLSESYQAAAHAAGEVVTLVSLPGVEHFALIDPQSRAWPAVRAAILPWLDLAPR